GPAGVTITALLLFVVAAGLVPLQWVLAARDAAGGVVPRARVPEHPRGGRRARAAHRLSVLLTDRPRYANLLLLLRLVCELLATVLVTAVLVDSFGFGWRGPARDAGGVAGGSDRVGGRRPRAPGPRPPDAGAPHTRTP